MRFIERSWDTIAAFHRLLGESLRRDAEAWAEDWRAWRS